MATLTINTTAAQDARIVAAFGAYLGLGRNATGPEVKQALIGWLTDVVHSQETAERAKAAIVGTDRITPT